MHGLRLPRVYQVFVLLQAIQLVLLVTLAGARVPAVAVAFDLLLLVGLANGSRVAWGLLLLINGVPLLAATAIALSSTASSNAGQGMLWGNVAVLFFTCLALEATLLSPAMHRRISRRHRAALSA